MRQNLCAFDDKLMFLTVLPLHDCRYTLRSPLHCPSTQSFSISNICYGVHRRHIEHLWTCVHIIIRESEKCTARWCSDAQLYPIPRVHCRQCRIMSVFFRDSESVYIAKHRIVLLTLLTLNDFISTFEH